MKRQSVVKECPKKCPEKEDATKNMKERKKRLKMRIRDGKEVEEGKREKGWKIRKRREG